MSKELAILGGEKAVKVVAKEDWQPPYDEIKTLICDQIDRNAFSGDWKQTYFRFEDEFREYIGARYCTALSSGTLSLWAAYYGIGIKPGDEVIVPSYTWVASVAPAVYMGAKPVFCEIEEGKLVADPEDIRKRITTRTKAITVVHIYGNVVNMDEIMKIAHEYNLYVIEDSAHCHGAQWRGKKAGTIGHVGCFSLQGDFYNGKPIPAGEGGILVTDDSEIFNRAMFYTHTNRPENINDAIKPELRKYLPTNLGVKFRAHPFALSIALAALTSLDFRNEQKFQYRKKLYDAFRQIPGVNPIEQYETSKAAGFYGGMQMIYDGSLLDGLSRDKFVKALTAEGVDMTHRDYEPLHLIPLYQEGYDIYGTGIGGLCGGFTGYKKGDLPVTERTYDNLIGMPVFAQEPEGYSNQVIEAFKKVTANYKVLL